MQNLYQLGMDFLSNAFIDAFSNIELFFLAYVLALVVFLFRKNKNLKALFVYPVIFALFTVYNPFLMIPLADKIGLASRIRRIYWLLPVNLVLAFVMVCLIQSLSKHWKRFVVVVIFMILTYTVGENQLVHMVPAENIYKIKNETLILADILEKESKTSDTKSCIFTEIPLLELRQYDPSILNIIRRNDMLHWSIDPTDSASVQQVLEEKNSRHIFILALSYGLQVKPSVMKKHLKKQEVQYIISHKSKGLEDYFENIGCKVVGETENYLVFHFET